MGSTLSFEAIPLLHLLDRKGLGKAHPEPTADLVLFYLMAPTIHFYLDEHVANLWKDLRASGVPAGKLAQIRQEMFRLGHDPGVV
jgi:hypothetical protein